VPEQGGSSESGYDQVTRQRPRWLRNVGLSSPLVWVVGLVALSVALGGVVWAQQRAHESRAAAGDVIAAELDPSETPTSSAAAPQDRDRSDRSTRHQHTHKSAASQGSKRKHAPQSKSSPRAKSLADTVEKTVQKTVHKTVQKVAPPPPTTFRLASLNVLGSSHTARGGNKPRYASGSARMHGATALLSGAGADVVGFQELEQPQFGTFMGLTHGAWAAYPGMSMGRGPVRNSVAWRTDSFSLVDRGTIPVPYFHGQRVPMPWVLLEHKATGRKIFFVNIHNPVSNSRRGNNERWRDMGTSMEVALVNKLKPTAPVVLMGDFNERAEAFCRVTRGASMHAANGGVPGGGCRAPAGAGIDWIFGTPDVGFSGYLRNQNSLVRRTTDHPLVTVTVTLDS
jgi:endonuclease/exonuclease/phosphatase family metal-dependent hydrolase